MISQLAAYGALWIAFPLLVFSAARWGGLRGAIAGHLLVALLVVALDVRWVMRVGLQPTESHLGIAIAILVRACVINAILLPVSIVVLRRRATSQRPVA
jgi:hypothetical protein